MDIRFKSVEELKNRLMPALKVRKRELKRDNCNITEEELWNYLLNKYWKNASNLSLAKMVDDILNRDILFDDVI